MDYVFSVCGRKCSGKLLSEFQHSFQRHLGVVPQQLVKILAFDKGHGDELHAGDFAHVVNAKYVFVRDFAGEDQFLLEAVQGILFPYDTLADHLNRNRAIQLFVSRFIDAAHAALTEERLDAVTRAEIASRLKDGRVHRMNGFGVPDGQERCI